MLIAKIHKATVTEINLNYEGSLTIDESLMKAADMLTYEQAKLFYAIKKDFLNSAISVPTL